MGAVNGNGSRPLRPRSRPPIPRSLRLLIGAVSTLIIALALVVPVVLHERGTGRRACARTLVYQGHLYVARQVPQVVQAIAIGVGVARGCGASPSNVNIRSVAGVKSTDAVALAGEQSSIYVRRGMCSASSSRELLECLRRRG
jgi:hypothetical protein